MATEKAKGKEPTSPTSASHSPGLPDMAGLSIEPEAPPQPPRPSAPPRPSPLSKPQPRQQLSDDESDGYEDEDENDPFADRNAVVTPKLERDQPGW